MQHLSYIFFCLFALALATGASFASLIEFGPWVGAVTPQSAVVKVVPKSGFKEIYLHLQEAGDPNGRIKKVPPRSSAGRSVEFALNGLKPDTHYDYLIEVDSAMDDEKIGGFQTFPDQESSFRFVFASCAQTGSDSSIFKTIQNTQPLFFLNAGDLHYDDISENEPELFRKSYQQVLASPAQAELYRKIPLVYMWDDHDYAGNNSDSMSKSRSAARQVYQEMVPHYPLVAGSGDVAIYQSFVVGRVKFIVADLRSERSPASRKDDAAKTMFGEKQKAWFKQELLDAKGKYPLVFWVSSVPWISEYSEGKKSPPDFWGSYATERQEISDFIANHQITGICILGGDAHMLAADDGTNSNYSTSGSLKIPVLQAGPLDRPKSLKGGPYSEGVYLPKRGEGCFGLVNIEDTGAEIRVSFSGRNHLSEEKLTLEFTVPTTSNQR